MDEVLRSRTRAVARGMPLEDYCAWRMLLRDDYRQTFPRTHKMPRTLLPQVVAKLRHAARQIGQGHTLELEPTEPAEDVTIVEPVAT